MHDDCMGYEIRSSGKYKLPCTIVVSGQEGDSTPDLQSLYLHVYMNSAIIMYVCTVCVRWCVSRMVRPFTCGYVRTPAHLTQPTTPPDPAAFHSDNLAPVMPWRLYKYVVFPMVVGSMYTYSINYTLDVFVYTQRGS